MVGKLTTDEEEMTTLQLSVMIVLQDKIWGRDTHFRSFVKRNGIIFSVHSLPLHVATLKSE